MRLHITLGDDLVRELDRRVGPRGRSSFVSRAVERALDDERRWELIESALGAIQDHGHDWDAHPASWVHEQRRLEERSVG
jgi:metal-responsive CopG/Arc/MetJ family transcriptional regulator